MRSMKHVLTLAALTVGVSTVTDASAATAQREKMTNAAGNCQAALPAFEGLIRKRPLAVQNEGIENAFVTCSLTTDTGFGGSAGTELAAIWFINNGAATKTISCTAVIGRALVGAPIFIVKSVDVGSGSTNRIAVDTSDNGGVNFSSASPINFSCNLPAETGISNTYVAYQVNVGA